MTIIARGQVKCQIRVNWNSYYRFIVIKAQNTKTKGTRERTEQCADYQLTFLYWNKRFILEQAIYFDGGVISLDSGVRWCHYGKHVRQAWRLCRTLVPTKKKHQSIVSAWSCRFTYPLRRLILRCINYKAPQSRYFFYCATMS